MTTTGHKPTEEQAAVIAAVASGTDSVMVDALAGCTKSTTLQMAAPQVKVPAMALAFNKKISEDLKPRLPGNFTVKTFNGLGHGAVAKALPGISRLELDDKKLGKLVSQIPRDRKVDLSGDQWDQLRQLVRGVMQAGIVPEDRGTPLALDTQANWEVVADGLWIDRDTFGFLYDMGREILTANNALTEKGVVSFDDQVYYSACIAGQFPKFPVVFVDESQDLSPLNHAQLAKSVRDDGRLVVVGDPKQCHPPGTMVRLTGGKSTRIEDIQIGDRVVSYNRKVGFSGLNHQGALVEDVSHQHFTGDMVRVNTEHGATHDCTPNHKCLVKWVDKKCWVLYLMQKGEHFRIGIAQAWYTSVAGGFGPGMRARQERADAMWVLETFDSKDSAQIQEKVIWTKFGLPDLIFHCSGKASSTQAHLDAAWAEIGSNKERAKACLEYFNRSIHFPLWEKGVRKHIGEKKFITQACNLISGCMAVNVFHAGEELWSQVWVGRYPYNGAVIGLTVGSNGYGMNLYLANDIVTHNSIYSFRGADSQSMGKIRLLRPGWKDCGLMTTFRCPKTVVARQQEHAPGYKAWATNAEGAVHRAKPRLGDTDIEGGWGWTTVQEMAPWPRAEIMVLCRNNGPLFSLAFKLIRQQVGVVMLGRDIGKNLVTLSKKLLPDDNLDRLRCSGIVAAWIESESSLARANGHEERVASITDRGECLLAVIDSGCRDAGELRQMLVKLFSRDSGQVTLSSIHRAKGLECDVVLHLDPWRIPSKFAKQAARLGDPRQLVQEWNLKYVCETRTKHTLIEANLEDFLG